MCQEQRAEKCTDDMLVELTSHQEYMRTNATEDVL